MVNDKVLLKFIGILLRKNDGGEWQMKVSLAGYMPFPLVFPPSAFPPVPSCFLECSIHFSLLIIIICSRIFFLCETISFMTAAMASIFFLPFAASMARLFCQAGRPFPSSSRRARPSCFGDVPSSIRRPSFRGQAVPSLTTPFQRPAAEKRVAEQQVFEQQAPEFFPAGQTSRRAPS